MPLVLAALLAVTAAAVPPASAPSAARAAALAPAALGGRLVLRDGARALTPREARKALGKPLALHLRSGWNVVAARLDDDGFFVAEGAPGDWVIEYVSAGDLVEFVDPPMRLAVRGGEVACAGRIELAFRDLGAELGHGTGRAAASDDCKELQARLQGAAPGRTVRTRVAEPAALPARRSAWELEDALRAGLYFRRSETSETHLSATAAVGLNRAAGSAGAVVALASFAQADVEGGRARRTVSAGLGYWLGSLLEVSAGPELQLSGADGSGPGVFGQLRLGPPSFGLGLRAERGKAGGVVSYGLDLAPLWLLGALL
jgi:hypothetical protein